MLNYIGSKKSLLQFLEEHIKTRLKETDIFADLFAGTGCVASHFRDFAKAVVVNDAEYYSYVINMAMLKANYSDKLNEIVQEINNLQGTEGIITKHYAIDRMFFTLDNGKKIDSMRQKIEELKDTDYIDNTEYYFLLASLILAADKVANTASIYGAYLKQYKASAKKNIVLTPIHTKTNIHEQENEVFRGDTLDVVVDKTFDVVYIDPPYNHRQYSANYSLLNYLALYDDTIEIKGKAGLIADYFKSSFCKKADVLDSFDCLMSRIKARVVFISYNNEGIAPKDDMIKVFEKYGDVILHKKEYKKFLSHKEDKHKQVKNVEEYLFQITMTCT
jgi:adenine-specific DNA-methyltransferase